MHRWVVAVRGWGKRSRVRLQRGWERWERLPPGKSDLRKSIIKTRRGEQCVLRASRNCHKKQYLSIHHQKGIFWRKETKQRGWRSQFSWCFMMATASKQDLTRLRVHIKDCAFKISTDYHHKRRLPSKELCRVSTFPKSKTAHQCDCWVLFKAIETENHSKTTSSVHFVPLVLGRKNMCKTPLEVLNTCQGTFSMSLSFCCSGQVS